MDQNDDGKRGKDHDQGVTTSPRFDHQVDRECDRRQPSRRIHEHERQQRARPAEHAGPGEHRRRGGRIHERKETTALGPGVDIKPLSNGQAHLIPEAVILGRSNRGRGWRSGTPRRPASHRPGRATRRAQSVPKPPIARLRARPRVWLRATLPDAVVVAEAKAGLTPDGHLLIPGFRSANPFASSISIISIRSRCNRTGSESGTCVPRQTNSGFPAHGGLPFQRLSETPRLCAAV